MRILGRACYLALALLRLRQFIRGFACADHSRRLAGALGRGPSYPALLPAPGIEDQSLPWGRRISSFTERAGDCTQRRTNSCHSKGVPLIPCLAAVSRERIALIPSKHWNSQRLLKPSPLKLIATIAVPTLSCCWLGLASASRYSASPISRHTPATISRRSGRSTRIPAIWPSFRTGLML